MTNYAIIRTKTGLQLINADLVKTKTTRIVCRFKSVDDLQAVSFFDDYARGDITQEWNYKR